MFSLSKPNAQKLAAWIAREEAAEVFTTEAEIPAVAPRGFRLNLGGGELGSGPEVYAAACKALLAWEMFPGSWVNVLPNTPPAHVGQTVGVLAHSWGVWAVNACRVVDLSETCANSEHRRSFTYATVGGHVYLGAERFAVVWEEATNLVRYELASYSKARHPLIKLIAPYVRGLQRRFAQESHATLRQAVAERLAAGKQVVSPSV